MADTYGFILRESIIHTKLEEARFTPIAAPGVPDYPIFFTVIPSYFLISHFAEANYSDSVVDG